MRIGFLDFEFGQVYGSWRRDFLPTEAGILIYDTKANTVQITEKLYFPDTYVVLRKSVGLGRRRKTHTKVVNLKEKKTLSFDKNFKISKKEQKRIRENTRNLYYSKMRNQLTNIFQHCDTICVFGGNEDINLLNRYRIKIPHVVDLQTAIGPIYKRRISLDKLCHLLKIDLSAQDNRITSCGRNLILPKKTESLKYNHENINPHNAIGDSIRLFLVYKELFIYSENNPFKVKQFSNI